MSNFYVVRNRGDVKFSVVDKLIPDDHAWMIDYFKDEQDAYKFVEECYIHYDEYKQGMGE